MKSLELAKIGADQDQEIENAKAWLRAEPQANQIKLWLTMQAEGLSPVAELVARFAAIGFVHVMQLLQAENPEATEDRE